MGIARGIQAIEHRVVDAVAMHQQVSHLAVIVVCDALQRVEVRLDNVWNQRRLPAIWSMKVQLH